MELSHIPPLIYLTVSSCSSLSAILMTIIGVQCGHVLVHLEGHSESLKHWMIKGLSLLSLGFVLHFHKCYLIKQTVVYLELRLCDSRCSCIGVLFFYVLGAAVTLSKLGEYSRAASLLETLSKQKTSDPEVYRLLGEVKYKLKDFEGSAAAFKSSASVTETIDFEVLRGLTNALLAAKKPDEIDPRHRYGHNLHFYYDIWFDSESTQPFFYWLDVGDGKEVNIERCPRIDLQRQCIKYLGPIERANVACIYTAMFSSYHVRRLMLNLQGRMILAHLCDEHKGLKTGMCLGTAKQDCN